MPPSSSSGAAGRAIPFFALMPASRGGAKRVFARFLYFFGGVEGGIFFLIPLFRGRNSAEKT